jgi:uncharacterized protein
MPYRFAQLLFATLLLILLFPLSAVAADEWEPWETPRCAEANPETGVHRYYSPSAPCPLKPKQPERAHRNYLRREFAGLVRWFQRTLSPLDGPKCPHYPTCSEFARQAINKYGPLFGVLMAANRLTREYPGMLSSGDYPLVLYGMVRAYDPIELEYIWSDEDTVYYYMRHWREIRKK